MTSDSWSIHWLGERTAPRCRGGDSVTQTIQWVSKIRKALSIDGRPRWVIPQNGEALVESKGYLRIIDAIGAEDVSFPE